MRNTSPPLFVEVLGLARFHSPLDCISMILCSVDSPQVTSAAKIHFNYTKRIFLKNTWIRDKVDQRSENLHWSSVCSAYRLCHQDSKIPLLRTSAAPEQNTIVKLKIRTCNIYTIKLSTCNSIIYTQNYTTKECMHTTSKIFTYGQNEMIQKSHAEYRSQK